MAAPNDESTQTELIEAARLKFNGVAMSLVEDPPALDDVQTFTVKAKCTDVGYKRAKDGELRHYRVMEVLDVVVAGPLVRADTTDRQLSLIKADDLGLDPDDDPDDDIDSDNTGADPVDLDVDGLDDPPGGGAR